MTERRVDKGKRLSRAERDYGLPRLNVTEAARVLGLERGVFWLWLVGQLLPSPKQISNWTNDTEPLPEAVIRLYLTTRATAFAEQPEATVSSPNSSAAPTEAGKVGRRQLRPRGEPREKSPSRR